jgi:HEAT repeats
MSRILSAVLIVALSISLAPAAEESLGFFTPEELDRLDDALSLLNMDRSDLAFDKLTKLEEMRRFRLPIVDRTLTDPLSAATVANEWALRAAGTPVDILAAANRELGFPDLHGIGNGGPLLEAAEGMARQATAALSETERDRLRRWAFSTVVEGSDDLVPAPEEEDPEAMLDLAERVDRTAYLRAALLILGSLDEILAGDTSSLVSPEHADRIVIAGEGDDVHDLRENPPLLLIDRGGDDRYLAPARATPDHPVAIVIDLGGDDVYGDGESLSCGVGFFGVGVLWDRGDGDDQYHSGHLSQGAGLFGVGVLFDEGGNDVYRCRDTGQGAGGWGAGLLLDRGEGNDFFHADLFGQGFAYVAGFGLLHNEKGQDVYDAGGVHLHYPLFNDRYQSLSQGFSIGMRPYASGGAAFLIDDAGNDRYACDIYGQGASYWFSYGALVDRDGNDTYNLGQYGQGGGIHLAVGCLLDLAGQDLYYNMHGVGTGGAHDFAVGILVDRAGDDYYAGSGGTLGGALTNSFALLLDAAGNDGYSAVKVNHAEGGGRAARGMGSIGVLLDLMGKDLHGTRELDGNIRVKEQYGALIDLEDPPVTGKAPAGRPKLSAEEAEARVREAAFDEERGAFDPEKLWDLCRQWPVGEMADVVPVARAKFHELGDASFEHVMALVGTKESLEFLAVQDLLKKFGERSVPPLIAMLADEDARRRGRAAGLLADLKATAAATRILPLLNGEKTKLSALDALARMGERSVWESVAARLTDDEERVRVAAARCLEKLDAKGAIPALIARLGHGEMFTVRFAAEDVLVSFGVDALPTLRALAGAEGDRTARRHAIRALGRLRFPEALPLLAVLVDNDDWLLRFEAVGALLEFLSGEGVEEVYARYALAERLDREDHPHVRSRIGRGLDD